MTSTSSLSRLSELRFGNERVEKSTWKKISPGRTFAGACRGPCRRFNCPSNRLRSADYIAVARGRSLVDTPPTGTAVTAVNCIVVDDVGRRSLSRSTEALVPTEPPVAVTGRHESSRNVTDVLNHLSRVRSRTDRRTVERCLRGRDAASTLRRLERRPAVA